MNLLQAIFLGLVQGLTEFLPVSSSGHLAIFQEIFKIEEATISFDIILHLGTLMAVLIFFRKKLINLGIDSLSFKNKEKNQKALKVVSLIIIGTIPAIVVGILAKDQIESFFSNIKLVGLNLIITGFILFLASKVKKFKFDLEKFGIKNALIVGFFQAIAILPGISRSGSTTSAASFLGLERKDGFYFSFLLSIPAILGAVVLDLPNLFANRNLNWVNFLIGLMTAFGSGLLALGIFEKVFLKNKIGILAIYCFVLGLISIFVI